MSWARTLMMYAGKTSHRLPGRAVDARARRSRGRRVAAGVRTREEGTGHARRSRTRAHVSAGAHRRLGDPAEGRGIGVGEGCRQHTERSRRRARRSTHPFGMIQ